MRSKPDPGPVTSQTPADAEQAQALRVAARREHELLALSELSQELTIRLDLYAVADIVLLNLMGQIGTSRAALWLVQEGVDSDSAPVLLRCHGMKREVAAALSSTMDGMIDRLVQEPGVLQANEFGSLLPATGAALALREGIELFAPIRSRGDLLGIIALGTRLDGSDYGPLEMEVLQASLGMAGVALQNTTLYNRLFENNRRLRAANEDLKELDRLKSEFLRNINHELRTPLTIIIAYLASVLEHQEHGTQTHEFLTVSMEEAHKLKGMLERLLDFDSASRRTLPLEIQAGDVGPVLRGFFEERLPGVTEGLREFTFEAREELPRARFDRHRLLQIVDALIDNAIKFTPRETRITLGVRPVEQEGRPWICIEVADNGPGIHPDRLSSIFQSFHQGDGSSTREIGGLGLGLSLAQRLAELMNGKLMAESRLGQGSRFCLLLPVT